MQPPPLSVLILTRNESEDIRECLASVEWADDVHVFDSFSDDTTIIAAEAFGAIVTQHEFEDFATQRNAALSSLPFRNPWVLVLDADERVPVSLADEITRFFAHPPPDAAACRLRRTEYFRGRRVAHGGTTPTAVRLVRPERVRYERLAGEVVRVDGPIHSLTEAFEHHPFAKGIDKWLDRHTSFATLEARQVFEDRRVQPPLRRAWTSAALFVSPIARFLRLVFLQGALFDGAAGLTYAGLQAFYKYLVFVKVRETQVDIHGRSVPT